jgi:PAS domain S-box-containing protein
VDYAIYILDLDGRVISWNAGAERIKGYTASEIVGSHFSRFYTLEDAAAGMPSKALDTVRREGRLKRKDGGFGRMVAASGRAWSSMLFTVAAS